MKTKKGKRMSEFSNRIHLDHERRAPGFARQKEGFFATARAPLAHPIRALFYTGALNGYIDYLEFSTSQ